MATNLSDEIIAINKHFSSIITTDNENALNLSWGVEPGADILISTIELMELIINTKGFVRGAGLNGYCGKWISKETLLSIMKEDPAPKWLRVTKFRNSFGL